MAVSHTDRHTNSQPAHQRKDRQDTDLMLEHAEQLCLSASALAADDDFGAQRAALNLGQNVSELP